MVMEVIEEYEYNTDNSNNENNNDSLGVQW